MNSDHQKMSRPLARRLRFPRPLERRLLVAAFALAGFLAPLVYGLANGYPVPNFHDEFSYLLGADTFAHGRLANPTPAFAEHFEAPQYLIKPVYMSRYPPMQAVFLAAGQVAFGHPAFGVWLSCGLAAGALFWMLLAWTRPPWAMIGAALFIALVGTDYYWAQSYWGGMVAFAGGALFFGGFRRVMNERELVGSTLLMSAGGIILVNSRPFEGTVTMAPALLLLLFQVLRRTRVAHVQKVLRIVLPGAAAAILALAAMGYFNYRITGSALRFPYTEHQSQYFSTPLFIFQKPGATEARGTPRLQRLYRSLDSSELIRNLDDYGLPRVKYLFPVYAFGYMFLNLSYALLYPPLMLFLIVSIALLARKSRWSRFLVLTIAFAFACISFATYWDFTHYVAPLGCLFYALTAQGLRRFRGAAKNARARRLTALLLGALVLASVAYQKIYPYEWIFPLVRRVERQDFSRQPLDLAAPASIKIEKTATQIRNLIEETAAKSADKYLIIVSYDEEYTHLDEIVFNRSDLETPQIVWALDLGPERNRALIEHYKDRRLLLVTVKGERLAIAPAAR